MVFKRISIVIISYNREKTIGSTVMLLRKQMNGSEPHIIVMDNGSTDRTSEIATKVGASVTRYRIHKERRSIIRKALEKGSEQDSNIIFILDLAGNNTADDVIALHKRVREYGKDFASGFIQPYSGDETIGCWALDRDMLKKVLEREGEVKDVIMEIAQSQELQEHDLSEIIERSQKRIMRKPKLNDFKVLKTLKKMRKHHPLTFFGTLGFLVFLGSMLSTFHTVDYFYKHQHLAYFPAFITLVLVMISGFLFVAGLMINAFNTLIERLEALSEWVEL